MPYKGFKCYSATCWVSRLYIIIFRTSYNALLYNVILHCDRTELTCVTPPTIMCYRSHVHGYIFREVSKEECISLSVQRAGGLCGAGSRWQWRQPLYLLQLYELHRCFPKQMPREHQTQTTDPDSLSVSTSPHMKPSPARWHLWGPVLSAGTPERMCGSRMRMTFHPF